MTEHLSKKKVLSNNDTYKANNSLHKSYNSTELPIDDIKSTLQKK